MFYGWLLAVLGYNLKADESVASQFCAHLYKSAWGCGIKATLSKGPAATHVRIGRKPVLSRVIDLELDR